VIIVGTTDYHRVLGRFVLRCPGCGRHVVHQLLQYGSKFTLFFVPLFPVSRRYHLTCGGCGLEREVSGFDADVIQQGRHQ